MNGCVTQRWLRHVFMGVGALACLSCAGSEKAVTPVTPAPAPTVSLFASTAAVVVPVGTSTVASLTLSRGGGFAGDVTLGTEGVPAGISVSLSPVTIAASSTSSVVTIAVSSGAAPGTSAITIRASGNGVASSAVSISVTVPAPPVPSIALVAAVGSITVTAGTSGTLPLSVTRSNYTGDVALSISGLPAGVTASFAPGILTGSTNASTLTLSSSLAASSPLTTISVTASGIGVTSQTTTFALTIMPAVVPDFSLSASPASLSVVVGQSATSTVSIARTGGFSGAVTLSRDGATAGVTTSFSPNPATATSAMTVSVAAATAPGSYDLVVRGAANGQSDRTTRLALSVVSAPGIALTVGSALNATVGAVTTLQISVARTGNYGGDVSLTVADLPSGVTAAFTPSTLAGSGTTSVLELTVAANALPGATPITVRAAGAGVATQSASVVLTLVAAQGYSIAATTATATQGSTGTSAVTLTRSGGFAATVTLAVTGLPLGVTAAFTPTAVSGNTSSLALTVPTTVSPGTYSTGVLITGTAAGVANVTAPLTLMVLARPVLTIVGGGAGTGTGRVTSTPAGIDCVITNGVASSGCSAAFNANEPVQLQVSAGTLVNWTGGCTGAGACTVTMTQDRNVGAVLALPPVIVLKSSKPVIVMNRTVQDLRENYAILNGGGGTLAPVVSPPSAEASSWLKELFVTPTSSGHALWMVIKTTELRATSEANSPYRTTATISAPGAASVQVEITFAKSFDQPSGMAATVVRFHVNPE